jgi:gluconokinase
MQFHPPANIQKMAAGIPLTDADRWDWLIALRQQSTASLDTGAPGVVLTCSALKLKYRDVIRVASYNDHDVLVHFIYLKADEETLLARVKARQGHYMKDSMVRSQFQSLEEPTADELSKDVLCVDVSGSMVEVQRLAIAAVKNVLDKDAAIVS